MKNCITGRIYTGEFLDYNKNLLLDIQRLVFYMYRLKNGHDFLQVYYKGRLNLNTR